MITEYFRDLSGKPKTEELLDRYITDPVLKEHIRQFEAAFPKYTIEAQELVSEGDLVAVRGTVGDTYGSVCGHSAYRQAVEAGRDAFLSPQQRTDFQVLDAE